MKANPDLIAQTGMSHRSRKKAHLKVKSRGNQNRSLRDQRDSARKQSQVPSKDLSIRSAVVHAQS